MRIFKTIAKREVIRLEREQGDFRNHLSIELEQCSNQETLKMYRGSLHYARVNLAIEVWQLKIEIWKAIGGIK